MFLINKIYKKIKTFSFLFKLSNADRIFYDFSKKNWQKNPNKKIKGEVLTDLLFEDMYTFQLSYIVNFFYKNYDLTPTYYHFIPREKFFLRFFFSILRKFTRIRKLFFSFGSDFAFGQKKFKKSKLILNSLQFNSKNELLDYQIDGTRIGDLIYDSYLRTYQLPTVELSDKRLYQMILNALDVYFSCEEYLETHNVKKVVLSHAVYINYGILARVALKKGIDVYNPHYERVFHKLSIDHLVPTLRHSLYTEIFSGFSFKEKERCRLVAKKILEERLEGKVDRGIAYMSESPYQNNEIQQNIFLNNGKPKVVLMLHCFYDAPHVYKDMLFEDFFEWFDFVLSRVEKMDVDFVVKPHPNGKPYNERIIKDFQQKYPKVRFIDKKTSNKQIISENISTLLTVYGSIAHEFAYLGIPVLLAGDNPTSGYKFCYIAKSKIEYNHFLLNIYDLKLKLDLSKSSIEEFFYMHYLHPHMGRIEGNNDLFNVRMRDNTFSNTDMFIELVQDAKNGHFDNVFSGFKESMSQLDEY